MRGSWVKKDGSYLFFSWVRQKDLHGMPQVACQNETERFSVGKWLVSGEAGGPRAPSLPSCRRLPFPLFR
jgi:hypothetical protein